jgi:hypothetical protein
MKVVSFGYGPWRWYRGVTEVWGIYIYTGGVEGDSRRGEERRGKETDRCPLIGWWKLREGNVHWSSQSCWVPSWYRPLKNSIDVQVKISISELGIP